MSFLATMKNTITDDCFTYQEDRSRKDNLGFRGFFLSLHSRTYYSTMMTQTKDPYISPECEVLEIKPEGVIAASGDAPDMAPGWEWNF